MHQTLRRLTLSGCGDSAATEPNCPCHWLSTPDDYLWFYDTLASAVKTTLGPNAKFGPGNMPRGMQMGMVDTGKSFSNMLTSCSSHTHLMLSQC